MLEAFVEELLGLCIFHLHGPFAIRLPTHDAAEIADIIGRELDPCRLGLPDSCPGGQVMDDGQVVVDLSVDLSRHGNFAGMVELWRTSGGQEKYSSGSADQRPRRPAGTGHATRLAAVRGSTLISIIVLAGFNV